jgi:hypothetical protein
MPSLRRLPLKSCVRAASGIWVSSQKARTSAGSLDALEQLDDLVPFLSGWKPD